MTASVAKVPHRRGACPGLSTPMATGDGLLVRLMPVGTIPLAAFAKLCKAARVHGNGIIEVTSRGSIQIRGLHAASAAQFAAEVAGLGIAAADGIPVLTNALAGLDPQELIDAGALAAELRTAWQRRSLAARLGTKVSIVIDSGGALSLNALSADVRLCAESINGAVAFRVAVGGDYAGAVELGSIAPAHAIEAAIRLLEVVAAHGRNARARDILALAGGASFRAVIANLLLTPAGPRASGDQVLDSRLLGNERKRTEPIGVQRLRDGSFASGISLAFGHANATSLERLTDHACEAGATGLRAAPGGSLMAIGLAQETEATFANAAERLGFIVHADDPRRHVVACAGAPICASAHIAARAMAPNIAAAASRFIGNAFTIHISGCTKGCAHPAPAEISVVGTPSGCGVILNGSARDAPHTIVPPDELHAAVEKLIRQLSRKDEHV